jgi:glycosyltransferase involved in cell wall biosynthesis
MRLSVIFDVRCLQDALYRDRGVGRVAANLVRSARKFVGGGGDVRLTGLVDSELPPLEPVLGRHFDQLWLNSYRSASSEAGTFVELSPMTHDPLPVARLFDCSQLFRSSIVYDFIPLEEPERYLRNLPDKLDYYTKLNWLGRYDHYFPISKHTKAELERLLRIPEHRISVSPPPLAGAFVVPAEPSEIIAPGPAADRRSDYILVAGGGDDRKNVDCAIVAHAISRSGRSGRTTLRILGGYPPKWQAALQTLHAERGGAAGRLVFVGHVSDEQLATLYRGAACVVVPSRTEGFSIPVVEAMAAGTAVLASAIPAHRELVDSPEFMFEPDDSVRLAELMDRILIDSEFRAVAIASHSGGWQRFAADEVARDFWTTLQQKARPRIAAPLVGGRRPKIAVLGPLPPDRSGVADYTAATFKELGRHAEIYAFTPTESPGPVAGMVEAAPISAWPHLTTQFDRVVNVMGNSHFHLGVFNLLMRYGGACIEHDNRLLGFYRILIGSERAERLAERELGRPLEPGELDRWMSDEATLEATLLEEVARQAEPLVVHSRGTARLVKQRFGIDPVCLPFSVYREWQDDDLTAARRMSARARLGIPQDEIAIVTTGFVAWSKAPLECLWALDMLRSWGIAARLYFVGQMDSGGTALIDLCNALELTPHVRFVSQYVSEAEYRDHLLAADAAVQLRTHLLGGLSGALLDCIAAGLPTVANHDLAEAMEAPSYVFRVPDRPSPVLIAEALASAINPASPFAARNDERRAYCDVHSFRAYAEQLCVALSLDPVRHGAA